MKNKSRKKEEVVEKRLCAQEIYFWLLPYRNSIIISIVFILVLAGLGVPIVSFPIAIFVIAFLVIHLRKVVGMIKYLERKYNLKGRMKA